MKGTGRRYKTLAFHPETEKAAMQHFRDEKRSAKADISPAISSGHLMC